MFNYTDKFVTADVAGIETSVSTYNDMASKGDTKAPSMLTGLNADIRGVNTKIANVFYNTAAKEANPLLWAAKTLEYEGYALRRDAAKDNNGNDYIRAVLVKRAYRADLPKMFRAFAMSGRQVGVDPNFEAGVAKLHYLITRFKGIEYTGAADIPGFPVSAKALGCKLVEGVPSKTGLLNALNKVVEMGLGSEYKALNHDVAYLCDMIVSEGRSAGEVKISPFNRFCRSLMVVLNRITTNGKYSLFYGRKNISEATAKADTKADTKAESKPEAKTEAEAKTEEKPKGNAEGKKARKAAAAKAESEAKAEPKEAEKPAEAEPKTEAKTESAETAAA